MAKSIMKRPPDWPLASNVVDIYSVSGCLSRAFADYINFWKHNGFWLFDSPSIIEALARDNGIDLASTRFFYYEVHELQYEPKLKQWLPFFPNPDFKTQVAKPEDSVLEGYDIVNFYVGNAPECSPLTCNSASVDIDVNSHCLLKSFDIAKSLLEDGYCDNFEPGPYRIFAVYSTRANSNH